MARHMEQEALWVDVRYGASVSGGLTYSDGQAMSSNWLFGNGMQPAAGSHYQRCGVVRPSGVSENRITGVDCQSMRHFVCERAPLSKASLGQTDDDILGLPSGLASSSAAGRRRKRSTDQQAAAFANQTLVI